MLEELPSRPGDNPEEGYQEHTPEPAERAQPIRAPVGDPLRPYVHQHRIHYDFQFAAALGEAFAAEVAAAFAAHISKYAKATGSKARSALRDLLRWIVEQEDTHPDLVAQLRADHTKVSFMAWEAVLHRWREWYLATATTRRTSQGNHIKAVNLAWSGLHAFGVVPKVSLKTPKHYRRTGRSRKTLAEVPGGNSADTEADDIEGLLAQLPAGERNNPQTRDFLAVLVEELGSVPHERQDLAQEIIAINRRRLDALRAAAERHLIQAYNKFLHGERMVRSNQHRFAEIRNALLVRSKRGGTERINPGLQGRERRQLLPDCDDDQSLANLLTFLDVEFGGFFPTQEAPDYKQAYAIYCRRFGGVVEVESYLHANAEAVVAALVIILVETGLNVTPGRKLEVDCITESESSGYKDLRTRKRRAGNRQIVAQVPVKDPVWSVTVPQAVRMVQEMTARARRQADARLARRLFIYRSRGTARSAVISLKAPAMRFVFNTLKRRSPELSQHYTLEMIRPSLLLSSAYKTHGNLAVAQVLADHQSQQTTRGYTNRWPIRVVYENQIRKFQELFQIVAIHHIADAAKTLGLTSEQAARLFSDAHRTGLGVGCLDPRAGIQPGTRPGQTCTRQDACVQCPQRIFVATPENTADLILFNDHLGASRESLEACRSERWERFWLPWYIFTQVVLEKMERGPERLILKQARELADQRLAAGAVHFPPLA